MISLYLFTDFIVFDWRVFFYFLVSLILKIEIFFLLISQLDLCVNSQFMVISLNCHLINEMINFSRRRSKIFIFIFFNFSINFTDSMCVWRLIWIFFTFRKNEQNSISKFQTNFSTHTHFLNDQKRLNSHFFFSPNFANFPNPSSLNSLIETKKNRQPVVSIQHS